MSLKELTLEKHKLAESTQFMKSVFAGTLPQDTWIDYTYQKSLFYLTLEGAAGANRLFHDLLGIQRAFKIMQDYWAMNTDNKKYVYKPVVIAYHDYLLEISKDPNKIMAHVYTWHMGDLYGGQMIKRVIPGSHLSFEFEDRDMLINNLRAKLDDSMGDEANVAFDWAIKILKSYDN